MLTLDYFVIFDSNGNIKATGQSSNLDSILINLNPGDTYNWRDQIAVEANGDVWSSE